MKKSLIATLCLQFANRTPRFHRSRIIVVGPALMDILYQWLFLFQLEAENTLGYLRALHAMILAHGIPLSLYRDRHAIFQRNDAQG